MKRVHLVSLGCPKNRVDSEVLLGVAAGEGYAHVDDAAQADVIVVNTCGFIETAKEESIQTTLELARFKEEGQCQTLVMAGCLSQRYADELAQAMPEVDYFLGSSDMLRLADVLHGRAERLYVGNPADFAMRATDPRVRSQGHLGGSSASAYMKIAEGCNRQCAFCSIPSFRGKLRSRPLADLVAEGERLVADGVVEVNLVSQDTIAYGRDLSPRASLAQLIAALGEVGGLRWIRVHYLYPERLDPALLELLAAHPKVVPYIDMPLQHASDGMLRAMRRGHGGQRLYDLVGDLREKVPGLFFRTAFIAGHPGESDEDFVALERFVAWAEFDHVGVFLYSPEEGTPSGAAEHQVATRVARQRQRKLMALQRKISRRKLKAMVGQEVEVLIEGESQESEWLLAGRHAGQAPEVDGSVVLANGEATVGQFRRALITAHGDYDLVGELLTADGKLNAPPGWQPPRGAARAARRYLPLA